MESPGGCQHGRLYRGLYVSTTCQAVKRDCFQNCCWNWPLSINTAPDLMPLNSVIEVKQGLAPAEGSSPSCGHQAPHWGRGQARTWACGPAQVAGAHGQVGQGCGEPETGPAALSQGQGLMARRSGRHGVLGRGQGASWALVGGQGCQGLLVPSGPWHEQFSTIYFYSLFY